MNNTRTDTAPTNRNEIAIFKNYAPFINCISEINNTKVDNAKDTDIVMSMYNLNIVIIIQKHMEAYGNIIKIYLL